MVSSALDLDALRELLLKASDLAAARDTVEGFPYPSDPEWNDAVAQAYEAALQRLEAAHQAARDLEVAAVNALPTLLDLVSRMQEALRKTQWAPLSHLLNEHQMVDDEWPEGVEPRWNSPCMLDCGGGSFHGHAEGCALRSLLPREPKK